MKHYEELEFIAGLFLKESQGLITNDERLILDRWKTANPVHADQLTSLLSSNDLFQVINRVEMADIEIRKRLMRENIPIDFAFEQNGEQAGGSATLIADLRSADAPAVYTTRARTIHFLKTAWFKYAAAILIAVAVGAYLWTPQKNQPADNAKSRSVAHVDPGRQGAILTLADGTVLVLDSLGNGVVAEQNGTKVLLRDGSLTYKGDDAGTVTYNTMSTPRGRQFSVHLPDGTKVWLNATSSITYPTSFRGNYREVKMSGEAYFDVTTDASKPFRVIIQPGVNVEVLGTELNVSAYSDEREIVTTLINGAVNINAGQRRKKLEPRQQAYVVRAGSAQSQDIKVLNNISTETAVAWKNGVFNFNNKSLESIMRELSRWYDIEVVYPGEIPDKRFWGEMGMDLKLEDVLEFLRKSNVHITYETGRRLIVTP